MSRIYGSPVKGVDKVALEPFPARATKNIVAIARTDGVIMASTKSGVVYCNVIKRRCAYRFPDGLPRYGHNYAVFQCLKKLKVLSPEQVEAHLAAAKNAREAREKQWSAKSILRDAESLGIKFNKSQKSKINRHLPEA